MNDIINWLNNEVMRLQVYHNHKETMAWVATALYVSGAFTLGWYFIDKDINCCQRYIVIIAGVVITGLAYWFVCWQFSNRRDAASKVRRLIVKAKDYVLLKDTDDKELKSYFEDIEKNKDDTVTTMVISLATMGIAFLVSALLICC